MLRSAKFAVILVCTIAVSEDCPEVACGQNETVQRFISNLDNNNDSFLTLDELYDLAGLSKDDLKCQQKWLLCKRVVNSYYIFIDIDNDSRLSKVEIDLGFVFQDMNGDGKLSFKEIREKRPSV